jgi:hypothetical protein
VTKVTYNYNCPPYGRQGRRLSFTLKMPQVTRRATMLPIAIGLGRGRLYGILVHSVCCPRRNSGLNKLESYLDSLVQNARALAPIQVQNTSSKSHFGSWPKKHKPHALLSSSSTLAAMPGRVCVQELVITSDWQQCRWHASWHSVWHVNPALAPMHIRSLVPWPQRLGPNYDGPVSSCHPMNVRKIDRVVDEQDQILVVTTI